MFRHWSWTGQEYLSKIITEADLAEKDFFQVAKSMNILMTLSFRILMGQLYGILE